MDHLSPAQRSDVMSRIRGKDTRPELLVRRFLHGKGLRYRLHDKRLPGAPDIVFPSRKIVLFVHGCFWHSHPGCKRAALPATRTAFWSEKIASNVQRDQRAEEALRNAGWRVITVWQCEINDTTLEDLALSIMG